MKQRFFLALITFVCAISANAQTADDVLAKYFANTGGVDKWKALTSFTQKGKAFFGQEFPFSVYAKTPNKLKVVVDVQGVQIIPQCYDGTTAWMLNPMQGGKEPVKMDEEQSKELKDEAFEDAFIDYKKKGHEVALMGTEEIDGVKCFKLQLVKNKNNEKDDVTEVHFFDSENYVPIMKITYIRTGPQKGTEVKSYLSDYQDVKGLMFPFSIEQKMNGQTISKLTVQTITLNDVADDSIFAYPKK